MSWGILPYIVGTAVGEFFWPSKKPEEEKKKVEEVKVEVRFPTLPIRTMEVKESDLPEHLRVFDRY